MLRWGDDVWCGVLVRMLGTDKHMRRVSMGFINTSVLLPPNHRQYPLVCFRAGGASRWRRFALHRKNVSARLLLVMEPGLGVVIHGFRGECEASPERCVYLWLSRAGIHGVTGTNGSGYLANRVITSLPSANSRNTSSSNSPLLLLVRRRIGPPRERPSTRSRCACLTQPRWVSCSLGRWFCSTS